MISYPIISCVVALVSVVVSAKAAWCPVRWLPSASKSCCYIFKCHVSTRSTLLLQILFPMDGQTLSYAQRRALNIARNAERMRAIGLTTIHVSPLSPVLPARKERNVSASNSQISQYAEGAHSGESLLRRSGRVTGARPAHATAICALMQSIYRRCCPPLQRRPF